MSKVDSNKYIVIQGWMVEELKLKGNELLVYAIIYGFSQDNESYFSGSLQYLADWTNSSKESIRKVLLSLLNKKIIIKKEKFINNIKFCKYQAIKLGGIQQSCTGYTTKLYGGIQQSCINNINNNIEDNIDNIYDFVEKNFQRVLSPLEMEEIMQWEDNDLTRYAIKQAVLNGARSIKYINTILSTYKAKGVLSVEEAIKENEKFKNSTKKNETIPEWFDKEVEVKEVSSDEKKEMEDLLKKFR